MTQDTRRSVSLAARAQRRYFPEEMRFLAPGGINHDGRRRARLGAVVALMMASLGGCRSKDEVIAAEFKDTFERHDLGSAWLDTGGHYGVDKGRLIAHNAYNHPAWLRKRLPRDVTVELDVQSNSSAGDIKVELFGDGASFDPDRGGYVSTGYVFIFGGWRNSLSVICRNNEHDDGRKAMRTDRRVEVGRSYHFTITRTGGHLEWLVDGQPFLAWTDPQPLAGAGHEYFAVNDWEAEVSFDNLTLRPAP